MASKIKVDSIETVSGSGTISIPTGNNLSVAGTSTLTGAVTAADIRATTIKSSTGNTATTIANDGTVTFSNPPTGAGSMIKLLDTNVSSATNYDINNTYINSTYDSYKIIYNVRPATDNQELLMQYFMTTNASGDAGSIISGNHHAYQSASMVSSTYKQNNTSSYAVIGHENIGNATGEGINIVGTLMNVNDTTMLVSFSGTGSVVATNGAHRGFSFHTGMATPATYGAYYCRGVRFYMGGGGTHTGRVKLFGIK